MTVRSVIALYVALMTTATAFPCISNVSVEQSHFEEFDLKWTNGCSSGTLLDLSIIYAPSPTFRKDGYFTFNASEGLKTVGLLYLNSENRLEIRDHKDNTIVNTLTFSSLAAPPVLSSQTFREVYPRGVSLQWDSATMAAGPIFKNPKGTLYEIQMSTTASFDAPASLTVSNGSSPDTATVGCLTPETRYFARVRAINRAGVPTPFLSLGSTVTLSDTPAPTVFSWTGNRWVLSLSAGELTGEDQLLSSEDPLGRPLLSPALPGNISAANEKLQRAGEVRWRPVPGGLMEIQASRACPVQLDPRLEQLAQLTYTPPTSGDHVETGAGTVRRDTLSFYRLDAEAGMWNKIPSRVEGGKVTATVRELGTLAVMGQEDVSLQDLRVSPNPFRQGTDAHITFANLSKRATVKIFSPAGREVWSLEETDGDGILLWDGKNSSFQSS